MTIKETVTFVQMVANIKAIYSNATATDVFEGTHWYDSARAFAADLAARYGTTVEVAASVIAAHSMNTSWRENMRRAEQHLSGDPKGLQASIRMADMAIQLHAQGLSPFDAIEGPKINPFARNVAGDLSHVATDRWAQRAAFNSLDDKVNTKYIRRNGMREDMIDAYKLAALNAGIEPAVMQAIVWTVVRGSSE